MPRKTGTKTDVVETAEQPVEKPSKRKAPKEPVANTKTETKTETKADAKTETNAETTEVKTEKTTRKVPTRESVTAEFDELCESIDAEILRLRDLNTKSKGIKFLRSVNKRVKLLKNHAFRMTKQRAVTKRNNNNSGFLKPVQISKELAKFTGWDNSQPRSRVDVTKFICNYIKEHNLQNPEDRRQIRVDEDPNLKKLLKFDGKNGKPLTYYSLQTHLKSHFVPTAPVEAK